MPARWANNLVPDDTNRASDAFVHDRLTGRNEIVSLSTEGEQVRADDSSAVVSISADGRVVAFNSYSSELVPGNTNEEQDVFARIRAEVEPSAVGLVGPLSSTGRNPAWLALVLVGTLLIVLALRGTRKPPPPRRADSA